jgi:SAM-dependent methyltransferase
MATTFEKEQALEEGLVQTIFKPCAALLVKLAHLQPDERFLDVGCGSGIVARAALELQPKLKAAHGFDFEAAAVEVAQLAARTHTGASKLDFWIGDANTPAAYRGPWDVCIAQHVVQHVPGMLMPLRQSLANGGSRPKGGRAVIATWPPTSKDCPAYDFLYRAAGEGEKSIGMSTEELLRRTKDAGFGDVVVSQEVLQTPPVTPRLFLKQYLEGKQSRPPNIEDYLARLDAQQPEAQYVQFDIVMNVAIAHA